MHAIVLASALGGVGFKFTGSGGGVSFHDYSDVPDSSVFNGGFGNIAVSSFLVEMAVMEELGWDMLEQIQAFLARCSAQLILRVLSSVEVLCVPLRKWCADAKVL